MAIIKVLVPDGDSCKGCHYEAHSSFESHYQSYTETYSCQIFKCKLDNHSKCNACKILCMDKNE